MRCQRSCELRLHREARHGVDEEPLFVLGRHGVVPPGEGPISVARRELGSPLALFLLGVDDPLQGGIGGQAQELLDPRQELVVHEGAGEGTSWMTWFFTGPRKPSGWRGVIQLPLTWT